MRRMDAGDPAVPLQHVARAMQVFSELERMAALLNSSQGSIGLMLVVEKLTVCLGQAGLEVGDLSYAEDGAREYYSFAYRATWLARA